MTDKAMVPLKHCQIHLSGEARAAAAAAVYPIPHPEVIGVSLQKLLSMSPSENEALERDILKNEEALRNRAEFTGPHFHGIRAVQCSEGTLDVILEDGTSYLYPLHTVARAKVYVTQHTPE